MQSKRKESSSFFQSRDKNNNYSDLISHIEMRPRLLTLNLRLRDETEKKSPPISGIETRSISISIIFILTLSDKNETSLDLISK